MTPEPALHPVFETLGYAGGYWLFKWQRARRGDALEDELRWVVIAAAAVGALVGARMLGVLEQAPRLGWHVWAAMFALHGGGKTIVGGLLGGWAGVEIAKKFAGIKSRTGDLFAVPLCVGIAIGRIGCFWAGLADDTYGKATTLPWGVDFGDGVRRHPTQLYELVFLLMLGGVLSAFAKRPHREGAVFRWFMGVYLAWRVAVEFLKPQPLVCGMDVIQWGCVCGLAVIGVGAWRGRQHV